MHPDEERCRKCILTSYSIHAIGINTSQNKPISGEIKAFAKETLMMLYLNWMVFITLNQGHIIGFQLE